MNGRLNIAHSVMRVLVIEAVGWRKLIKFEHLLPGIPERYCNRVRCISGNGMGDTQHVCPGIAAGIRQIDWLERLIEGLAQKVFIK